MSGYIAVVDERWGRGYNVDHTQKLMSHDNREYVRIKIYCTCSCISIDYSYRSCVIHIFEIIIL